MRKFSTEEVLDLVIGLAMGGRGGGVNPGNPLLNFPTFGEALQEDRNTGTRRGAGAGRQPKRRIPVPKAKRRASAYSKRYGRAFKRLAPKYKKKNGSWKKDGFRRCAAAARREAKK